MLQKMSVKGSWAFGWWEVAKCQSWVNHGGKNGPQICFGAHFYKI